MADHSPYHYLDIGIAGEDLVAQWLQSNGWVILHRRWRYRNGEIDIIAQYAGQQETRKQGETRVSKPESSDNTRETFLTPSLSSSPILAFVEVKTRSPNNWDAGGRNAITKHKQAKLCQTSLMFLAKYPEKANYPCQFDVAIVHCQQMSQGLAALTISEQAIATLSVGEYLLMLQEYIPAAFDT
ncbi:YraN family protein [Brasilonema sp. UFV-L1]|uniref:YraN family protein n=1 Tax=Brasilonema sp. UFV-L1 TaxID=2234130 RepID=UPI00145CCCD7|nr:YraN family protein [Brasilonema sp. UFV-L1]NMG11256.1 YraN family protein [Brasilonema sp. UFV-L1]